MKEDLLISFSGGETSAYMTIKLLEAELAKPIEERRRIFIVFANTGLEHPKTLEFISKCEQLFGLEIIYLETKIHHYRKGSTFQVRTFTTLAKAGEPFEEMITKYGIPNQGYPHCTRELKINPIHSWAKKHLSKKYETAIGIRADEIDRMSPDKDKKRYIYPLVSWNITKKDILEFWSQQSFRLEIEPRFGNCVTCWKKSDKKLVSLMKETPEEFEFFDRMEKQYPNAGAGDGNRKFFRKHRSVQDLKKLTEDQLDDEQNLQCEESCEVY